MTLAGNVKLKTFVVVSLVVTFSAGVLCAMGVMLYAPVPEVRVADPVPAPDVAEVVPVPSAPQAVAPAPVPDGAGTLTAAQQSAMSWAGKDIGSAKRKDVSKGKPYKINVYQDEGNTTANRAKIDLDRDDKWDEKWTFGPDSVQRKVAPGDDENYSETYLWDGEDWALE